MTGGLLSGLSIMATEQAELLLMRMCDTTGSSVSATVLGVLASLEGLMHMAASTTTAAILLHCKDLSSVLQKLQLRRSDIGTDFPASSCTAVNWGLPVTVR